MTGPGLDNVAARIASVRTVRPVGRIISGTGNVIDVAGLSGEARVGDLIAVTGPGRPPIQGEVLRVSAETVTVLLAHASTGLGAGDRVALLGPGRIAPDTGWIGRVIDPSGRPLDGRRLLPGTAPRPLDGVPPPAAQRRGLGPRLDTGLAVFNTLLPIVRGQRLGLFAGSGVGKSSLLARLAISVSTDVVVIALVGERGREVRDFVTNVLGPTGMSRSIVVAATSDQSPLARRRCLPAAMAVAEHFRDTGASVLVLADSVTRFAEAHREVALAGGESAALRGYPPSLTQTLASLVERAGPGVTGTGDITAVLSVLVAGSDMDEPVADLVRGLLDGHVVLDRTISERGRFPPIDVLRSVSRSLPHAATADENALIGRARALLGTYARAELMIQAGLYERGTDPEIDAAVAAWPRLDDFVARPAADGIRASFEMLRSACDGNASDTVGNASSAAPGGALPSR
jgi:flagellum-specific ATP synthase